ncbi:MAG: FG-GAP-like repeat-containing protein [Phycisphaerales bacterium]
MTAITKLAAGLALAVLCFANGDVFGQSSSAVSYWTLDDKEGSKDVFDSAELVKGLIRGNTQLGEPGVTTKTTGAYFDGSGDYIEVPHHDNYLLDKGSVVLWFRAGSLPKRSDLFSKDSTYFDTGGHLTIGVLSGGKVYVRIQDTTTSYEIQSSAMINLDTWHHIVVNFGEGGLELYVDGDLKASSKYEGGLGTTSGGIGNYEPLVIGGSTRNSDDLVATPVKYYFTGTIDEVGLLNERLTKSTIVTLAGAIDEGKTIVNVSSSTDFDVSTGSGANGLIWADFDNDGDQDAIITGSAAKLLWNATDTETFSDVSLGNMPRQGAAADFDNDGDIDFWHRDMEFWENLGLGALTNRGAVGATGLSNTEPVAAIDVDIDGRLDFVMPAENGNWIGYNTDPGEDETTRVEFTSTTDSDDGLHVVGAYGNGDFVSTADVNNDGYLDMFYHYGDGWLFLSNGDGTFTTNSTAISVLTGNNDKTGSAWGDYDNDGDMDLWMSRYDSGQTGYLWRNDGNNVFTDVTGSAGLADTDNQRGCAWGDYDNDGDLDLAIAREGQGLRVYENQGDGSFAISTQVPSISGSTADVCFVDFDNDGDLDISVSRTSDSAALLRNDTNTTNHLHVRVASTGSVNGSGVGTRLELWNEANNEFIARREIGLARGYGGTEPLWAHFGGVTASTTYSLRVYYPGSTNPKVLSVQPGNVSTSFGSRSVSQLLTLDGVGTPERRRMVRWREVSSVDDE